MKPIHEATLHSSDDLLEGLVETDGMGKIDVTLVTNHPDTLFPFGSSPHYQQPLIRESTC